MEINKAYIDLTKELKNSKILKDETMSKHTSFKIGGNADIFVKAHTIEDIKTVLKISDKYNIPVYTIGNGSNLLVKDKGIRGIALKVAIDTINIDKKENTVLITVGAGVKLAKLAQDLLKEQIAGFEFAARDTRNHWWSN